MMPDDYQSNKEGAMKQDRPFWFNILFFSINLFLVGFPFYIGIQVFKHNPLLFALFIGLLYLFYAGARMAQVVKAIINDENL